MKKEYSNGEITIVWQPDVCIHSTICWRGKEGLPEVFNPKLKPWINMEGASSEAIMKKVSQCPSGALSYYKVNAETEKPTIETETIIEPLAKGPLLVYGNVTIKKADGEEEKRTKVTAFCRCGASQNKPFCDGTHTKIDFKG